MDAPRLDGIGLDPTTTSKSQGTKKALDSAPPPARPDESGVTSSDSLERSPELKARIQELKQALADLKPDAERVREAREAMGLNAGQDRERYIDAATRILLGDR